MTGLEKLVTLAQYVLPQVLSNATFSAANQTHGLYLKRIFEKGEDSNNAKIGAYRSKSHMKARLNNAGSARQIQNVDFNFTGDLYGSVNLRKQSDFHYQIFAPSNELIKIKGYEQRTGKTIIEPSAKEIGYFEEELRDQIKALLGK